MVRFKRNTAQTALRDLRRRKGLTQAQLAERTGVGRTVYAEAESGARGLPVEAAMKTAPVLGTDGVTLYLQTTVAALKASIRTGEERPVKAASVARALIEIIESGELSTSQRKAARDAAKELVALVVEAAEQRSRVAEEQQEYMDSLGRDMLGRKKPRRGGDAVDLDADYIPESGEYVRKSSETTYEYLDRDNFGR